MQSVRVCNADKKVLIQRRECAQRHVEETQQEAVPNDQTFTPSVINAESQKPLVSLSHKLKHTDAETFKSPAGGENEKHFIQNDTNSSLNYKSVNKRENKQVL